MLSYFVFFFCINIECTLYLTLFSHRQYNTKNVVLLIFIKLLKRYTGSSKYRFFFQKKLVLYLHSKINSGLRLRDGNITWNICRIFRSRKIIWKCYKVVLPHPFCKYFEIEFLKVIQFVLFQQLLDARCCSKNKDLCIFEKHTIFIFSKDLLPEMFIGDPTTIMRDSFAWS